MNTHDTWSYKDSLMAGYGDTSTLKFLVHKWKTPHEIDMNQSKSDEEMSYRSYELICRLLYGLTVAQLREPPREDVDAFINKYGSQCHSLVKRSIQINPSIL